MSHPQSAGLGSTRTGTSACDHTHPACYAARRTCCSNAALVGGMFSIVREPCANNSFHTPLPEHVQLYTTHRNLSIHSRVSELTSTGCRDRSRKASIADGKDLQAKHADCFSWLRQLDTVSHPLTALKSIYTAFFIDICNNLLDSNLSKLRMRVSASSLEHGWRYSTSLASFCVGTIVSSFVLLITFLPVSHACMQSVR